MDVIRILFLFFKDVFAFFFFVHMYSGETPALECVHSWYPDLINLNFLALFLFLEGVSVGTGGESGRPIQDLKAWEVTNSSAYSCPAVSRACRIKASQRRRSIDFI